MKLKPAILFAVCIAMAPAVIAAPQGEDAAAMVRKADFIFQGKVIDVAYRKAEPAANGREGAPHTFVTYRVDAVLKGKTSARDFTLRFYGGPLSGTTFAMMSDAPLFDVGDEDVLLVKNNTYSVCPLVECAEGRFRLIGGSVYGELGQTLRIAADGSLSFGRAVDLPEVRTHRMSDKIFLSREEVDEPKSQQVAAMTPTSASDFLGDLRRLIATANSVGEIAALPAAESADIQQPFEFDIKRSTKPANAKRGAERLVAASRLPTKSEACNAVEIISGCDATSSTQSKSVISQDLNRSLP